MLIENYFSHSNELLNPLHFHWNYGLDSSSFHRTYAHSSSRSPDATQLTYQNHKSKSSSSSMESLYSSNSSTSTTTFNFDDDEKGFRRVSVIVKATKTPTVVQGVARRVINLEHVCRWENCYRWASLSFHPLICVIYWLNFSSFTLNLHNPKIEYSKRWRSSRRMWTLRTAPLVLIIYTIANGRVARGRSEASTRDIKCWYIVVRTRRRNHITASLMDARNRFRVLKI